MKLRPKRNPRLKLCKITSHYRRVEGEANVREITWKAPMFCSAPTLNHAFNFNSSSTQRNSFDRFFADGLLTSGLQDGNQSYLRSQPLASPQSPRIGTLGWPVGRWPGCDLDIRHLFAYTAGMFQGPSTRKSFVVTCKRCHRDVPAGTREFPFQSISVICPLCGELRRYRPSEVFLGKADQLVSRQNRAGSP
jgi:hypothetical protein